MGLVKPVDEIHDLAPKFRKFLVRERVLAQAQAFQLLVQPPCLVDDIDQIVPGYPLPLSGIIIHVPGGFGAYYGLVP